MAENMSPADQDLRNASGAISDDSPLVSFLYEAMRDDLTPGRVEELMRSSIVANSGETRFCNGFLAQYAQRIADQLLGRLPVPMGFPPNTEDLPLTNYHVAIVDKDDPGRSLRWYAPPDLSGYKQAPSRDDSFVSHALAAEFARDNFFDKPNVLAIAIYRQDEENKNRYVLVQLMYQLCGNGIPAPPKEWIRKAPAKKATPAKVAPKKSTPAKKYVLRVKNESGKSYVGTDGAYRHHQNQVSAKFVSCAVAEREAVLMWQEAKGPTQIAVIEIRPEGNKNVFAIGEP